MSNETKRNVFLQIAKENRDLRMYDSEAIEPKELIEQDHQDWIREYDAALSDNLPVIPKAVGAFIKRQKAVEDNLATLFYDACGFDKERGNGWSMFRDTDKFLWAYDNQNTFARAWLLGMWRVEGTGEIVKLEDEK